MEVVPIILKNDNVFIIKDKKIVLFDTGVKSERKIIEKKFKEEHLSFSDVSLIVISHSHYHNAANAEYFKNKTNAPILIHHTESSNLNLGEPVLNRIDNLDGFFASFARRNKSFASVKPDLEFIDEFDLLPFGVRGKVIHTPGHTVGSSSVFLENNNVICGEVIIKKLYSLYPSFPYFVDDYDELFESYMKIMKSYPTVIFSSHGGPFSFDSAKHIYSKSER